VDHPHNDWVARLSELGLVGAACLLVLVFQALWTLQRERERTAPLIVASIALIANSGFHGVLGYDAGSSVIAMGLLGAVLSHSATPARAQSLRVASLLLLGITALELPRALAVLRHGSALSSLGRDYSVTTLQRASERALEACPHSVHARTLRAQVLDDEAAWQSVLEQRPERFEAWMQIGNLRARARNAEGAQAAFEHALRLDPWHPGLLENQVTLVSRTGTLAATQAALAHLRARKSVKPQWLLDRARRAWLYGNEECARWLHDQAALEPWPSSPDEAYGLFRARKQAEDAPAAEFFESVAQRGFARRNAEQGRYKEALRNYRLDLQLTDTAIPGGAPRVRWEFAACLLAQGEREQAQTAILDLAPVSGLPEWAVRALESRP
jgi:tetratricopeptide (TPR) repeat protein